MENYDWITSSSVSKTASTGEIDPNAPRILITGLSYYGMTGNDVDMGMTAKGDVNDWQKSAIEYYPANATVKKVTWTSSDPNIASIDPETGKITGVNYGWVYITATAADGSGVSIRGLHCVTPNSPKYVEKTVAGSSVTLAWEPTADAEFYYVKLQDCTNGDYLCNGIVNGTTCTVSGLSPNTEYVFEVYGGKNVSGIGTLFGESKCSGNWFISPA